MRSWSVGLSRRFFLNELKLKGGKLATRTKNAFVMSNKGEKVRKVKFSHGLSHAKKKHNKGGS